MELGLYHFLSNSVDLAYISMLNKTAVIQKKKKKIGDSLFHIILL